ncbi:MAG TPA: hypothetical protein ENI51_04070 [Candidatus Atribacteria bacterium]|nr:hypothetical protein [Candidatus Atribacteria bacterium]
MEESFSREKIERLLQFDKEDFPDLHQAAREDNIVLFLGAGLAKMYGCPLWNEMARAFVNKLLEVKMISYAEADFLSKEADIDSRKVISICYSICKRKKQLDRYEDIIREILSTLDISEIKKIYSQIFSINPKAYLTTNIDLGMKEFCILRTSYKPRIYNCTSPSDIAIIRELEFKIFKDGNIIYLHGNLENISNVILSIEKYLEHYTDKEGFLRSLFSNIRGFIIFIGYGLKEWDVIEKIYKIFKANKNVGKEWTACILTPIFTHEITKFKLERYYYESFGVRPVPYIIDDNGYKELYRVLENLINAIDKSRPTPYEIFEEIEEGVEYAE